VIDNHKLLSAVIALAFVAQIAIISLLQSMRADEKRRFQEADVERISHTVELKYLTCLDLKAHGITDPLCEGSDAVKRLVRSELEKLKK
jgi:hypothetical protein